MDSLNLTISTSSVLGGRLKCGFYYNFGVVRLTKQETAAVEKVACYSSQGAGKCHVGAAQGGARRQREQGELQARRSLAAVVSVQKAYTAQ